MKKPLLPSKLPSFFVLLLAFLASIPVFSQLPSGLVWDSAVGCEEATIEYGFNVEGPQACIKTCEYSTVTYTLVGGDPQQWINVQWTVTGGNLQNSTNTTATIDWGNQGWGSIMVGIETENGTFTREVCVEIIPGPFANFTVYPLGDKIEYLEVCRDELVFFENLSHPNGGSSIVSYNWHFSDDDTTSSEFEPSHVFTDPGDYTVTLTVTNACNCTASREIEVNVLENTTFKIECNSIVCENSVETYTVFAEGDDPLECEYYDWGVDGGHILSQNGPEVQVQWDNIDQDGFGYLTFYPESCEVECPLPVTIKVPVIKNDIDIDGPDKVCEGEQFRFSIPQWPSTEVEWEVSPFTTLYPSDQPNEIVFESNNPGIYTLQVRYNNTLMNCGGVASKQIEVIPKVSIQGPTSLCAGDSGQFTNSDGISVNWYLEGPSGVHTGSGVNFSHTFSAPGLYSLSLGQGDFCLEKVHQILVRSTPNAPTGIEGPLEVCSATPYTYSVQLPNEGTAHWMVENGIFPDLGPGASTTTGEEVVISFLPTGPYKIKVWNEIGGCASDTLQVAINPLSIDFDIFGAQTVCSSTYKTYSVDYLEGDEYEWSINPQNLGSIAESPQDHQVDILWNNVTAPTQATIEVEIEKCGQLYTESYPVTVRKTADIAITATPQTACRGESVDFGITGLSTWTSIHWDFGDGHTASNIENPIHQYTDLNGSNVNYTVTLSVEDPNSCFNTAVVTQVVQVQPAPVASINVAGQTQFCDLTELQQSPPTFSLVQQSGFPSASTITWYHDGSPMSPQPSSPFTPNDFGQYYAELESANGCISKTNHVFVIDKQCGPPGPGPGGCVPTGYITSVNAQITGCGTVSATAQLSGTPISYQWATSADPVDMSITNETSTGADFEFLVPGTYTITYFATYNGTDDNGDPCQLQLYQSDEVTVPYLAELNYAVQCDNIQGNYEVTLYNISTYLPGMAPTQVDFVVDGISQGPGSNDQITVSVGPGPHTLELVIDGPNGPPCTATIPIDLPTLPTLQINGPSQACAGSPVPFTASVNDPNLSYDWVFSGNAENSLANPIRNFSGSGLQTVSLTVTNRYGCTASDSYTIDILPVNMNGELNLQPPTACYGQSITLTYDPGTGTTTPTDFTWHHEVDGTIVSTQTTTVPQLTVTENGTYILDGKDGAGCVQERIATIPVEFLGTPTANISGPNEACSGNGFSLSASPTGEGYGYVWKRDGQTLYAWNDEQIISQTLGTGTYNYQVEVTSPSGCTDTDIFTVQVFPTPVPPQVSMQLDTCEPYTIQLTATHPDPGTFVWSDGQSGSNIQVHKGGPYRVTFFNQYGCTSSEEIDVPFSPKAYIWVHPEGCYEVCEIGLSDHYLSGPSIPFNHWEWEVNSSVVNSGSGVVADQNWVGDGFYQLTLDNGLCSVTSEGMEWEVVGCRSCDLELKEIEEPRPLIDANGNCYYIFSMGFTNGGPGLSYTIYPLSGNGTIVPGGGFLPNGFTNQTFNFYPPNGFSGGVVNFRIEAEIADPEELGENCLFDFSVNFPPCPAPRPAGNNQKLGDTGPLGGGNSFTAYPNPTQGLLNLRYQLGEGNHAVYLYDLYGRVLKKQKLEKTNGAQSLDLNAYSDGLYLLILRKNGKNLKSIKINLIR